MCSIQHIREAPIKSEALKCGMNFHRAAFALHSQKHKHHESLPSECPGFCWSGGISFCLFLSTIYLFHLCVQVLEAWLRHLLFERSKTDWLSPELSLTNHTSIKFTGFYFYGKKGPLAKIRLKVLALTRGEANLHKYSAACIS